MRIKTSITLPKKTLAALDRIAGRSSNRSRLIEEAIDEFLLAEERAERDARDLELLNRHAAIHDMEMADVLEYPAEP